MPKTSKSSISSNPSKPSISSNPSAIAKPPILQTSKPSNYLVTGGAGFIGSNIVEELVRLGHSVRVLDNFSTGKRENIAPFLKQIDLIEGDIRDEETCRQAVKDIDYVLHQAAMPSVPRSLAEPVITSEVNIMGTVKLLTAAAKAKVRRFVYAASSSAYGDQPVAIKNEKLMPMPLSPYAAAKLAGEYFVMPTANPWVWKRLAFVISTSSARAKTPPANTAP